MNYLHTLNTFLEQRFTSVISTTSPPCIVAFSVSTAQIQTLLRGLSHNQFINLINYLTEEGHILHADAHTITFCPHYMAYIYGVPYNKTQNDAHLAGICTVV